VTALSADRRFSILLLLAIAALIALAAAVPSRNSAEAANRATTAGDRVILPSTPVDPPRPLKPLWVTDLGVRFPSMTAMIASRMSVLPQHQIVSYYGNPYTELMGILGSDDLETVADLLEVQAARYDKLNGPLDVIPAIHLVYAVAQPHPTDNNLYLQYVDEETVNRYIALVEERDMLLFLDLQIGRSSVGDEVEKILPYLRHPNVHLALDPEFAVDSRYVPGEIIGSLDASDIDLAQTMLQNLVVAERLPSKLLMVHQFLDEMVVGGDSIDQYPGVELIVDMDGFGSADVKRATYEKYAGRSYATHAAIKLFFDYDTNLMSEQDVLFLEPTPAVVIYQ
jgi:hypothetical protein